MHCPYCNQQLTTDVERCPRCRANLLPEARRHVRVVTLVYALASILIVALIIFVALYWHAMQTPPHP